MAHHGIKGQKWGVRRYQNPDGTLTKDGQKRYNLHSDAKKKEIDTMVDAAKGIRQIHDKNMARLQESNVGFFERKRLESATKATKKELEDFYSTIDTMLGSPTYKERLVKSIKEDKKSLKFIDDPEFAEIVKMDIAKAERELRQINGKPQNNKNLTQRFDDALKDNPKLTYKQIYKEMKVDTRSEDPDVYKDAEDRWLRKHGY